MKPHLFCGGITAFLKIKDMHTCMAINVSVQYDGGFLPGIILSTQCYYHRGTRLNAMTRFCIFSY